MNAAQKRSSGTALAFHMAKIKTLGWRRITRTQWAMCQETIQFIKIKSRGKDDGCDCRLLVPSSDSVYHHSFTDVLCLDTYQPLCAEEETKYQQIKHCFLEGLMG
jgi:hypothetical protein